MTTDPMFENYSSRTWRVPIEDGCAPFLALQFGFMNSPAIVFGEF
jgi:hypothetical protein